MRTGTVQKLGICRAKLPKRDGELSDAKKVDVCAEVINRRRKCNGIITLDG